MALIDKLAAGSLDLLPRPVVRRVASRYVAGETLEEALAECARLEADGYQTTVDLLGEAVEDEAQARAAAETYQGILRALHARGLGPNVSVKPSHFGLGLSPALLEENLRRVLAVAGELGGFVRIDMEDHRTTDATLALYRKLRAEGLRHTGTVLQARLLRTEADLEALAPLGADLRLCKGVYQEPAEIALRDPAAITERFVRLIEIGLSRPEARVAIATHDDAVVEALERVVAARGIAPDRYEVQVLLGVRPELRQRLRDRGHRVRVYVPFGTEWYAYCVRRLQENPAIAGHVTRDVLRRPGMLLGTKAEDR